MNLRPQWKASLEAYNSRAPEMWTLISQNVDFEGKSVLDLGCGYGDMLLMTYYAGAKKICGIDKNAKIISGTEDRISKEIGKSKIELMVGDIETRSNFDKWDIIICFSVLPYLKNHKEVLRKIKESSNIALIEAQYRGEPYCLEHIKGDKDMREWLIEFGWNRITNIGYTDVEIRNAQRTIWRCRDA